MIRQRTKRRIRELRIAEARTTKEHTMNDTRDNRSPVIVSQAIYDGIKQIRESGITNMLDRDAVQRGREHSAHRGRGAPHNGA